MTKYVIQGDKGSAIRAFATLESEIAKFRVPPPKPWPWAVNSDGTVDMGLRLHQLDCYLADLKKGKITK